MNEYEKGQFIGEAIKPIIIIGLGLFFGMKYWDKKNKKKKLKELTPNS